MNASHFACQSILINFDLSLSGLSTGNISLNKVESMEMLLSTLANKSASAFLDSLVFALFIGAFLDKRS